jgi:hypothetical protein
MSISRASLAFATTLVVSLFIPGAFARDMGIDVRTNDDGTGMMGQMSAHMQMGPHMTITESRPATPEDLQHAREIVQTMRDVLAKYQDYRLAEADGYKPFMPTVPQDVYHFANRERTMQEYSGDFNIASPGSLLYVKKPFGGWRLVGAMYDAPPNATLADLDERIPLSVGHWHAHTNICLPKGITQQDVMEGRVMPRPDILSSYDPTRRGNEGDALRMRFGYMADPRFGFTGTISEAADCAAAGGSFHPQIFGWMIHVYPFSSDDLNVAFGTEVP